MRRRVHMRSWLNEDSVNFQDNGAGGDCSKKFQVPWTEIAWRVREIAAIYVYINV